MSNLDTQPHHRPLGAADIATLANVCKKTLYRNVKDGRFPKPTGRLGRKLLWSREVVFTALGMAAVAGSGA